MRFYSDQPIVLDLVSTNAVDFEAEPNHTVMLRCSAQGQPIPRLFYAWENGTEIEEPGDVPTNVKWRFDDNDSLLIDWDPVQYPNGNVTYILYLSNFVDRVKGPPVRIPQVPYNVNITLQISAENEWGEGRKSPPITFLTPNGGPKNAPSITSIQSKDENVTVIWQSPTIPNGVIKAYTIYFKNTAESDGKPWKIIQLDANRTEYTINRSMGLQENAQYKLKISATNEYYEGPVSETSWFDTYKSDDDNLSVLENVTAYLKNASLIVYVPTKHKYQTYIMYIRPEYGEQYWKYEAINVTESQEEIVIEHFPLDKNVRWAVQYHKNTG
ncbi:fibronectin type III domain protein [Dictyocaulus viviparus]|uniref:Fibronectin type III domain protein n=1 Tax=Dictyocaulus viviparus TaxID=29172 RepID=A0A0D8XDT4_DICVI|nr:fibronectin type III domain protein [Dictyocaulus viviparus]